MSHIDAIRPILPEHGPITIYYRWKGENVSTTEVSNLLTGIDFVEDACVYGVAIPGLLLATLTNYHTMPHFDTLKIYSCRKHCEKWRICLL